MRRVAPLLLVLLVGFALRVYALDVAPPGVYYDEAANQVDALSVVAGARPIFFPGNQGREPLQIYAVALATLVLGPGWLAIRLPSVLVGTATIAAAYLLGREAGGRRVGLLAAILLATSYWHLSLSRMGFRAVWVPLVGALALALWLRGLRTGRVAPLAGAGLALGVGLYTYLAARLLPLPLALAAAWARRGWRALLVPLVVAAVVGLPIGLYFLRHPELFVERVENVAGSGDTSPLGRLFAGLGTYVWAGDPQPRHNLDGQPVFGPIAGALFLLGVLVCLRRWRDARYVGLLATAGLMLLPQALASGEPHFLRAVGVLPAAQTIAAVGLDRLLGRVERAAARGGLVAALAVLWTFATARDYFVVWAPSRPAYEAFQGAGRDAAALLATLPPDLPVAAGSPIYASQPTYYLDVPRPPRAAFDGEHAVVLPADGGAVVVPSPPGLLGDVRARLGAEELSLGRWRDPDGHPAAALYLPTSASFELLRTLPARFGDVVAFDGYDLPTVARPGQAVRAMLGWRVLRPGPPGLFQLAHLVGPGQAGRAWTSQDGEPFPSREWRGGERVLSWFDVSPPPDAPLGAYWVETGFYETPSHQHLPVFDPAGQLAGDRLLLGPIKLWDPGRAVPRPTSPFATFDQDVLLVQPSAPSSAQAGGSVAVVLGWWAAHPTSAPLTVFVHLLDAADRERAGADGPPALGTDPTDLWQPGEYVEDAHVLHLPPDLPPGTYRIEVGLYDPTTGARLPLRDAPEHLGDGAIVATLTVR